jgi:hypothetical protein
VHCPTCGALVRLDPAAELVPDTEADERRRRWQAAEDEAQLREANRPAAPSAWAERTEAPPLPSEWPEGGPR